MNLELYLRSKITPKIREIYLKSKCEVCGMNNNLHLHHVKLFINLLHETLEQLNMPYKDIKDYTKNEINNITDVLMGKHVFIEYLTLCGKCHRSLHKEQHMRMLIKKSPMKEIKSERKETVRLLLRDKHINEVVIPHLEFLVKHDVKLYEEEQLYLSNLLTSKDLNLHIDYRTSILKHSTLQEIFNKLNLNYTINKRKEDYYKCNKRTSRRYLTIQRIL